MAPSNDRSVQPKRDAQDYRRPLKPPLLRELDELLLGRELEKPPLDRLVDVPLDRELLKPPLELEVDPLLLGRELEKPPDDRDVLEVLGLDADGGDAA